MLHGPQRAVIVQQIWERLQLERLGAQHARSGPRANPLEGALLAAKRLLDGSHGAHTREGRIGYFWQPD